MKLLSLILSSTLTSTALAAEFAFTPQRLLFDNKIEHLTAELLINNSNQTCLVDTGARYTIAKVDVLKNLEKVGEILGGGISNPNLVTDLVQTNLQLGTWSIANAIIGRSDRIPYSCLIGNDFFLNKSFTLNFKKNVFAEIAPLEIANFNLNVYQQDHGGHFGFEVIVGDNPTKSIFDTGASKTVVDNDMVIKNPEQFIFIKDLSATDGNNVIIKAGLYRLKSFKFAAVELKDIEVIAVDLSNLKAKLSMIDVIIGMDIIQEYNWSFDTKSHLWSFEKE